MLGQHFNPSVDRNHDVSVEQPVKWWVLPAPSARLLFFCPPISTQPAATSPNYGSGLRLLTKYECAGLLAICQPGQALDALAGGTKNG